MSMRESNVLSPYVVGMRIRSGRMQLWTQEGILFRIEVPAAVSRRFAGVVEGRYGKYRVVAQVYMRGCAVLSVHCFRHQRRSQ